MLMCLPLVRTNRICLWDNRDIAKNAAFFRCLFQHRNEKMQSSLPRQFTAMQRGLQISGRRITVFACKTQHTQFNGVTRYIAGKLDNLGLHFGSHFHSALHT
ncbi:hypothetical protein FQZ97_1229860 [compost metagenome]